MGKRFRRYAPWLGLLGAALVAAGWVAVASGGGADRPATQAERGERRAASTRPDDPIPGGPGHLLARQRRGTGAILRDRPGGKKIGRLPAITEFDSPRVFWVREVRDGWLGVSTHLVPNGRIGWVARVPGRFRYLRTVYSLHADISERVLELHRRGRVLRSTRIAVGRPSSPTPTGNFAVTDWFDDSPWGGAYGCCILAISATQTKLSPGWQGGSRVAIHGTRATESIGQPASGGCMRTLDPELRALARLIPLGTPVFVRS